MTSVEKHQASTDALAASAQSQALSVYTAYQAGRLTRDQAVALIVAVAKLAISAHHRQPCGVFAIDAALQVNPADVHLPSRGG